MGTMARTLEKAETRESAAARNWPKAALKARNSPIGIVSVEA